MRGHQQSGSSFFLVLALVTAAVLFIMAFVPAWAQNAVPATARQAAASPDVAKRLAHPTAPNAAGKSAAPACLRNVKRSPQNTVIYENGPLNGTYDAFTINFGYIVSNSFTVGSTSSVTGFDFYTWSYPGDTPLAVDWSITASENGGTVYGSGAGATLSNTFISTNDYGYQINLDTVSGLNVSLPAGTYWVNLQNAATSQGNPLYWDENDGVGCKSTGCPSLASDSGVGTIGAETFDVTGSSTTIFQCFEPAGKLKVIHDFTQEENGGGQAGVTVDKAGNVYGTVGDNGSGLAYKLAVKNQDWMFTPLYSFTGGYNGGGPGTPILGPGVALYGVAGGGIQNCGNDGKSYCGLTYSLRPSPTACLTALCDWTESVLYRSTGNNDPMPGSYLGFDQAGNLYGTCAGTKGHGGVCVLTPSNGGWTDSLLYSFTESDGYAPYSLVVGNDGNLYGLIGDSIFQLAPSENGWTKTIIYRFQNTQNDGTMPQNLVQDGSGNLFGTSCYIYDGNCFGIVFMLSPTDGQWVFTTLWSNQFLGHTWDVFDSLAIDAAGNLYGTGDGGDGTCSGGLKDIFGYVFKLAREGNYWNYSNPAGFYDEKFVAYVAGLDAQGNLYGSTKGCGKYDYGTVWQVSP